MLQQRQRRDECLYTHHQLMGLQSELFWGLLSNQSDVVLQEAHDSDSFFDKFIKYRTEGS